MIRPDPISDSDGKDDFTEGLTYETALNIAKGAPYNSLKELRAAREKLSFWDKVKLTLKGKTKVGRVAGTLLDVAELVAPSWAVKTRDALQSKQKQNPMIEIIKRAFTKSNGGFIRLWDEMKGRDLKYYGALILRLIVAVGVFYAADYLGVPVESLMSIF